MSEFEPNQPNMNDQVGNNSSLVAEIRDEIEHRIHQLEHMVSIKNS
jgi:hypothetical protein